MVIARDLPPLAHLLVLSKALHVRGEIAIALGAHPARVQLVLLGGGFLMDVEVGEHGVVEVGPVAHVGGHGVDVGLPGCGVQGAGRGGGFRGFRHLHALKGLLCCWRSVGRGAGFEGESLGEVVHGS